MAYRDRNPLPFDEKPEISQDDRPVIPSDEEFYREDDTDAPVDLEEEDEEDPYEDYDEGNDWDDEDCDGDCDGCPFCRIKRGE